MRALKFVILAVLLVNAIELTAQDDSIFAVVTGDTVTLWQTNAYRICGSLYRMEVNQTDDQIRWYQVDTGTAAYCHCTFDLAVTYGSLAAGYYIVNVYYTESYSPLDTIYAGTTSFTVGTNSRGINSGIISQYQSDCYLVGMRDQDKGIIDFRIYPVTVSDGGTLYVEVSGKGGRAILEVFTVTGEPVYSKQYDGNRPIQERFIKETLFPVAGIYLVRMTTSDQVFIKKISVL